VFKKIPRTRLYETVAEEIENAILDGHYEAGSRLPSEQILADQFEVSRNVVREALKVLQERGLVEVVDGSGSFVSLPNHLASSNALGRYIRMMGVTSAIDALYETRRALEGFNARLAAKRATQDQIQVVEECLKQMQENTESGNRWTNADLDFHLAIAKATNNPFQAILLEPLIDQLREVIAEGFGSPGAKGAGLSAHIRLLNCIRSHDAEGAYRAMVEHLDFSEKTIMEAHKENDVSDR